MARLARREAKASRHGMIIDKAKVDTILTADRVYTVDGRFSVAEAVAIRGGRIIAVGSTRELEGKYRAEEVLDFRGAFAYPGFIDPHCHLMHYGFTLMKAKLRGCSSWTNAVATMRERQDYFPSAWALGRGWDQTEWGDKDFPDNRLLDKAFPDKPALATRIDGHAAVVNTKALELAGVDARTEVEGGEFKKDGNRLTGLLVDNAIRVVERCIPKPDFAALKQAFLGAQADCFAVGLTSVSDAGLEAREVRAIQELQAAGSLKIRIYAMLLPTAENYDSYISRGKLETERLTVRSIKLFADGALGSRGALLLEPYSDAPETRGLRVDTIEKMDEACMMAHVNGYQVNTHCIGDAATRETLDLYAKYLRPGNDSRWRIEHAQMIDPADLPRFREYNVIPSVQASHAMSDMRWAAERLGERVKRSYVNKELLEQNGWIANGSDFPIEGVNPIVGFHAAVARKDLCGSPAGGFQIENALTREEALRAMTIWAAKANFEEREKGSIEPGKLADITIMDRDLLEAPESSLPSAKALMTIVGGDRVFAAPQWAR